MQRKTDFSSSPSLESLDTANPTPNNPSSDAQSLDSTVPPTKASWMRSIMWAVGFGVTAIAAATVGLVLALTVPLPARLAPQEEAQKPSLSDLLKKGVRHEITRPVNILVMGIDRVPSVEADSQDVFAGRSDTLLLVQVNPDEQTVSLLSIPRDTQVRFPGRRGVTKINHANASGGPRLAADVVSDTLGDISIDRYVRFSTDAFRELVDLLGGVEVFVPKPMRYVDETQKLYIDLDEGLQILDGDEAEQFARFRNDAYGDIGRVQRQQQLIQALRDRLTSPSVIPQLPQIIQLMRTHLDTNLSPEEMLALATFSLDLNREDLQMVMLPGRFSEPGEFVASYWIMDQPGASRVMQDYFGLSSVTYTSNRTFERGRSPLSDLHIAVQNASDNPRVASQVTAYLREQGFNSVYVIQDWPAHQSETQIIAQRGDLLGAGMLERVLGVGQVVPSSTGDLGSDLTIRVGNDWLERPQLDQPDLEL